MGKQKSKSPSPPVGSGKKPHGLRKGSSKSEGKVPTWAKLLFGALILPTVFAWFGYKLHQEWVVLPGIVTTKSPLPAVSRPEAWKENHWGTYRSNLYFGIRAKTPKSPLFGLMWYSQPMKGQPEMPKIRHWCDQSDGMKYSWRKHDGKSYGTQQIFDGNIVIQTTFVTRPGGSYGGDWSARIEVMPLDPSHNSTHVHTFIPYMLLPEHTNAQTNWLRAQVNPDMVTGIPAVPVVDGKSSVLGEFTVKFSGSQENVIARSYAAAELPDPAENVAQLKEIVLSAIGKIDMPKSNNINFLLGLMGHLPQGTSPTSPVNFVASQYTFVKGTTLDVIYESRDNPRRVHSLDGDELTKHINTANEQFDTRFEQIFKLKHKQVGELYSTMGQVALSNMLGGIGYFYGNSRVQSQYTPECFQPVAYGPLELMASPPSRPFFPRGFLWDEGFHQLLIHRWDIQQSLDIISAWLDLMNTEGWIPREMILGAEAEARVPAEFIIQRNNVANPPVFFWLLDRFMQDEQFVAKHKDTIEKMYPRLEAWYNWLNISQSGPVHGSYRWRGRNDTTNRELNPKTLSSGLDDYPRASHPSNIERHLDLYCWMAISTRTMGKLAKLLGKSQEVVSKYESHTEMLMSMDHMDKMHWAQDKGRYADYGRHTKNVQLRRPPATVMGKDGQPRPNPNTELERVTLRDPSERLVTDTFGYVSLFPLLLRMIPSESDRLGVVLKSLTDEAALWSPYGLRSLAANSPLYDTRNTEHDAPYWRGHVWLNVNYMALASLRYYADASQAHGEEAYNIYSKLRSNILAVTAREFQRSGFLWEHYDDKTGKGEGCHPFTGWTSLVLLILSEQYD